MYAIRDSFDDTVVPDLFGVDQSRQPNAPATHHPSPRILLAEDDTEMRRCLSEALRKEKYEVIVAEDGNRAMDFISTCLVATNCIDIDLAITDIRMTGVDGLRLLSSLRAHNHRLPVILITAFGNPELRAEALLRGAIAVFDKPFELNQLLEHVRHVFAGVTRRSEEVLLMDSTQSTKKHAVGATRTKDVRGVSSILVAEDDDEMRDLLVTSLKKEGFKVTGCCDAIDLLNVLDGYITHRVPAEYDLIISDIRMPWLTGLELLEQLRAYVGFPPVILITAFGDDMTHQKAQSLGAAAMLDKPFEMSRLVQKIREILAKVSAPDMPEGSVVPPEVNRGNVNRE